jgi:hypothetical protein
MFRTVLARHCQEAQHFLDKCTCSATHDSNFHCPSQLKIYNSHIRVSHCTPTSRIHPTDSHIISLIYALKMFPPFTSKTSKCCLLFRDSTNYCIHFWTSPCVLHFIPIISIPLGPYHRNSIRRTEESSALLSYYAASSGNSLPASRELIFPWRWNQ